MNRRDIRPGVTVYHRTYTHWGKGTVVRITVANVLENIFECRSGSLRVVAEFEGLTKPARLPLRELRKTPNRKKIKEMVEFYKNHGIEAVDGGDRLILPEKKR